MRQLRGGKTKETAKEKRQRKKEIAESRSQVNTIVIPSLIAVFLLIVAYVYVKSRPKENFN